MELSHLATFVDRLDHSELGPALSEWSPPRELPRRPVTTNGQVAELSVRARRVVTTAAVDFGISVEEGAPGGPITPEPDGAWHHVAVWCADLGHSVQVLEDHGYRRDVVGRDAAGELATFAYMVSPGRPRVELLDAALRDPWLRALAADSPPEDAGDGSSGLRGAPLAPDHVTAVVDDEPALEALATCWQQAFGTVWSAVREDVTTVTTADGPRELRIRSVRTSASPRLPFVSIIAPAEGSRPVLAPTARNGWHHAGIRSRDLGGDIRLLEGSGFTLEYRGPTRDGASESFAMMRSPEGPRIELTTLWPSSAEAGTVGG